MVLLWLVLSGRATLAMMRAAFVLPVFVQGGLRWRTLFGPLNVMRAKAPDWPRDLGGDIVFDRPIVRDPIDPKVVRRAVIALSAYVEHAARYDHRSVADMHFGPRLANGSENGSECRRVPVEEALDILGLEPAAGLATIREAHRRLEERLRPELGNAHYLTKQINEARDVLLEQAGHN
jgi:hypothetical protein